MKTYIYFIFYILMISLACSQTTKSGENETDGNLSANNRNKNLKLQIYYFYPTHRCPTCKSIETNVKKVLDSKFKDEVSNGKIDFKMLCVDDGSCDELTEKYQVSGVSLHLVKIDNGKETDNDFTEYAFLNSLHKPDVFTKALQDSIVSYIH